MGVGRLFNDRLDDLITSRQSLGVSFVARGGCLWPAVTALIVRSLAQGIELTRFCFFRGHSDIGKKYAAIVHLVAVAGCLCERGDYQQQAKTSAEKNRSLSWSHANSLKSRYGWPEALFSPDDRLYFGLVQIRHDACKSTTIVPVTGRLARNH